MFLVNVRYLGDMQMALTLHKQSLFFQSQCKQTRSLGLASLF